jgi:predicted S18 family serine protease
LSRLQTEISAQTNNFNEVLVSQKRIGDIQAKLQSLQKLSTGRFLQGNLLNALQQATVDNVRLVRIRISQSYAPVDKAVAEKIVLNLAAYDYSANPGDQINKFKEAIANQPYFKSILSRTNGVELASVSQIQTDSNGKSYEEFNLNCNFSDHIR